jgi:hypothetical protein
VFYRKTICRESQNYPVPNTWIQPAGWVWAYCSYRTQCALKYQVRHKFIAHSDRIKLNKIEPKTCRDLNENIDGWKKSTLSTCCVTKVHYLLQWKHSHCRLCIQMWQLSWDFPSFVVLCLLAEQIYKTILKANSFPNQKGTLLGPFLMGIWLNWVQSKCAWWYYEEKISWSDRVRNEEVLFRVNDQRNILHEIRKRKANWIGHILRRNCFLK